MMWSWIRRNAKIVIAVVVAIGMIVVGVIVAWRLRMREVAARTVGETIGAAREHVAAEIAAARAEAEVQRRLAATERQVVLLEVQQRYEAQKEALRGEEQRQAEALRDDPVALARLLARAGRRPR